MPLSVKNKSRRLVTINLLQDTAPATSSSVELTLAVLNKDGTSGQRIVERQVPATISWGPGETLVDLPEGLRVIEEFQTAVAAGRLLVTEG